MTNAQFLQSLALPFRHQPLDDQQLAQQVHAWADAFPHLCRVSVLTRTPQERPVWLMTLGLTQNAGGPSVWLDGNMHASETCGSSVALAVAESVLRLHLADEADGVPAHLRHLLRQLTFFVVPRLCPDGAEGVLKTGRYVRSNPRNRRVADGKPYWNTQDINGDGLALMMRQQHACGDFVESTAVRGLMVPRQPEDPPPYFKLYPEGVVENFDGHRVPDPSFLSDNDTDLNRNFPYLWSAEPQQEGAGNHPLSEPESRAVVEFTNQHPEIFAWVNLHTFGGVFIRPLLEAPDKQMAESDRNIYRQLEQWAERFTGYPMVSNFEAFTYVQDKPLHGAMTGHSYGNRGCISYVTELWDLFARAGIARRERFVDMYRMLTRADLEKVGAYDRAHNAGRVVRPWAHHQHPQLGAVEVGGLDPREGLFNPPREVLPDICKQHTLMTLMLASLAPQLVVSAQPQKLAAGVWRVRITTTNTGYLPTHILESAKNLPHAAPVRVRLSSSTGLTVDGPAARTLDHLEGWGRGAGHSDHAFYMPRSAGTGHTAHVDVVVQGSGTLKVSAGCPRTGFVECVVELE